MCRQGKVTFGGTPATSDEHTPDALASTVDAPKAKDSPGPLSWNPPSHSITVDIPGLGWQFVTLGVWTLSRLYMRASGCCPYLHCPKWHNSTSTLQPAEKRK